MLAACDEICSYTLYWYCIVVQADCIWSAGLINRSKSLNQTTLSVLSVNPCPLQIENIIYSIGSWSTSVFETWGPLDTCSLDLESFFPQKVCWARKRNFISVSSPIKFQIAQVTWVRNLHDCHNFQAQETHIKSWSTTFGDCEVFVRILLRIRWLVGPISAYYRFCYVEST